METIVIIATKNRPDLLKLRSLKSVYDQTMSPSQIIIVDDSDKQNCLDENTTIIDEFNKNHKQIPLNYILNHRTKGAAGSWNSAIDFILDHGMAPETTFIAILDDDDKWHSDYLKLSSESIQTHSIDMVACDFYRIEDKQKYINSAPIKLDIGDFLIGNPGIQGSNIFIRLSCFLEAGCFDENIQSSTDRDLCIRIADLGTVEYKRLATPLMEHFAESNRIRMSTPNTEIKESGLHNFWLKHSKRMSEEQKAKYLMRAKELFKWELPEIVIEKQEINNHKSEVSDVICLHVGVICSSYKVISSLLSQLEQLQNIEEISNIHIYLLENNLQSIDKKKIIIHHNQLKITFITKEMQDKWVKSIDYFKNFTRNKNQMFSIAQARTLLQKFIGQAMVQYSQSSIVWILDEDMQITADTIQGIKELPGLKKSGIDIAIGKYEFSSPNPPINGIRVQLVDLFYNLNWLLNQKGDVTLLDISNENDILINKYSDYYYDLSRKHFGHLEHPIWYKPKLTTETVNDAIEKLCKDAIKIFVGIPLTRPLICQNKRDIINSAKDSVNRGGTTFIFNQDALNAVPNLNMEIGGTDIRRSDMIWAIINRYYRKMNIKAVNIPIWHAGKDIEEFTDFDIAKIREEILGSCLYAGLTDFLKLRPNHDLDFTDDDILNITHRVGTHLKNRMILLKQSFYRIRGISKSIQNLKLYYQNQDLQKLVSAINKNFSKQNFALIESNVEVLPCSALSDFLNIMQSKSDYYKNTRLI